MVVINRNGQRKESRSCHELIHNGYRRMTTPATLHALPTAALACRIVGVGAICGVWIAAWAERDFPGLYGILMAIQVQVLSETERDDTDGQLPYHPRTRPRLKPCWWTEEASECCDYQVDACRAIKIATNTYEHHNKIHRSKINKNTQRRISNR